MPGIRRIAKSCPPKPCRHVFIDSSHVRAYEGISICSALKVVFRRMEGGTVPRSPFLHLPETAGLCRGSSADIGMVSETTSKSGQKVTHLMHCPKDTIVNRDPRQVMSTRIRSQGIGQPCKSLPSLTRTIAVLILSRTT